MSRLLIYRLKQPSKKINIVKGEASHNGNECQRKDKVDVLEEILADIFPNGIDEVQLNDLLWFDEDIVAEWLGYADFDELRNESVPW